VSAALKEHYSEGMSLSEAFAAALSALSAPGNGERTEFVASQLEVAILERTRDHRTFRRIRAARLEELIAEARSASGGSGGSEPADSPPGAPSGPSTPSAPSGPSDSGPATGPDPSSSDRGTGLGGGSPL
jgi:proteasome alpha subunit